MATTTDSNTAGSKVTDSNTAGSKVTDSNTAGSKVTDSKAASRIDGVLPRKFLRQLLFLSMRQGERSYGYELAEAVRGHGLAVDLAGVYRELRAMEQRDLLTSDWEPSKNGPDRRVYLMTDAGQAARAEAIDALRAARDQLTAALEQAGR